MPIEGRTPQECIDHFVDHLRALTGKVFGSKAFLKADRRVDATKSIVAFRKNDLPVTVPLETRYGRLH